MKQFGKLINGQLITSSAILIDNDWTTNPNEAQYISQGYKDVVRSDYPSHPFTERYEETETQIIIHYDEIVIPERPWNEQTRYQIKFAPVDLLELLIEVPAMIEYTNALTTYVDEFGNQYLYVNYFVDMEKELCERYGAIITERI